MVTQHADSYTGAVCIFIEEAAGNNAIIISPGIAATIAPSDIAAHSDVIGSCKVFITQLEKPLDAAEYALGLAKVGGATTSLNPAPSAELTDKMLTVPSRMIT